MSASAMATATAHVSAAAESATSCAAAAKSACRRGCSNSATTCVTASRSGRSTTHSAVSSAANATAVNTTARIASVHAVSTAETVPAIPMPPAPAVPRADADEEAAAEPLRSVIAIRGAGVGVIRVVAPIANRGAVNVGGGNDRGTDAHSHRYLGICRGRERQSQKHREQNQAHFPHKFLLVPPRPGVPNVGTGAELRFQHLPGFGILYPTGFWLLEQQSGGLVAVSFDRIVHAERKGKSFMQAFRG